MDLSPETVVREHSGIVRRIAAQFTARGKAAGYEMDDLMQEGMIALLDAAEDYDASLGFTFSTHASKYIETHLRRVLRDDNGLIRLPGYLYEARNEIAYDELIGRESHPDTLALVERKRLYLHSLDEPAHVGAPTRGERLTIGETVADADTWGIPEEMLLAKESLETREAIAELRNLFARVLPLHQRAVMLLLVGCTPLATAETPNLARIGRELCISRERVRLLRDAAMDTLKPFEASISDAALRMLLSAVRRTSRAHKTTKPADTTPQAGKRSGAHATGVSSTVKSSEPSTLRSVSRRTGTPRRAVKNSTSAA